MGAEWIALAALAVWRVTHVLHAEDGPWNAGTRLRRAAGQGVIGQALDCFNCLSLWVSLPVAAIAGGDWRQALLLWLGLSGAAIVLERITAPATFIEDPPQGD